MKKTLEGIVVANAPTTAVVQVLRKRPHPLYKKLITRVKRYKVDTQDVTVNIGDNVAIVATRPISKDKHFKVLEVLKK